MAYQARVLIVPSPLWLSLSAPNWILYSLIGLVLLLLALALLLLRRRRQNEPVTIEEQDRVVVVVDQLGGQPARDTEEETDEAIIVAEDLPQWSVRPKPPSSDDVAFTSHYPREVAPQVWDQLLVFIALDTPEADAQVEAMAAERLRQRQREYRAATIPGMSSLHRGARLTIAPHLAGFRFDPLWIPIEWTEDVQSYEFRLRAEEASPDQAVNGSITILEGLILRGEIPLSIFVRGVRQPPPGSDHIAKAHVTAYRNTFPSYSRQDEPIVRAFETVVEASGDRFLRDVRILRAGEEWESRLLEFIDQADVFQLFWSKNAAQSQQVEREWRYALNLRRPTFIRPVYWSPKPYPIPTELQPIDFGHLNPEILGFAQPS